MESFVSQARDAGKSGNYIYGKLEAVYKGKATVLITGSGQRLTGLSMLSDNLSVGDQVIIDYSSGVPPFVRGHGEADPPAPEPIIIDIESIIQDVAIQDVSASICGDYDQIITKDSTQMVWFNRTVFDEYDMFSGPSTLIIPMQGLYYVSAQILCCGITCDYDHRNRIWMALDGSTYGSFAISVNHHYEHEDGYCIQAEVGGVITAEQGEIITCRAWLDSAFAQHSLDLVYEGAGPYATLSPAIQIFKLGGGFYFANVDGVFTQEFPNYNDPAKIELDANSGYMYVSKEFGYARAIGNSLQQANQNLTLDFQFQEDESGESYFSMFLKSSIDWYNWAHPTTGYELQISSTGGWSLWRYNSGVQTLLDSYNSPATKMWQKLEFEVDGSVISAKTWVKGDSEPSFQVAYTDGSPITGDGGFQLGHFNLTGARWLRIDNVSLGTP